MNKNILIALVGLIVIGSIWFAIGRNPSAPMPEGQEPNTTTTQNINGTAPAGSDAANQTDTPMGTPATDTYSLADIASHNSRTSCYTAINGSVYDVTNYIDKHPAGPEKILAVCGKDGSSLFEGQHGGNEKIANMLAGFKIGTLK